MPTKEELSDEINEMLDTDVDWSRLLEDDLKQFKEMAEAGVLIEPMIKLQVKEKGKEKVEQEIDDWYPGKLARRVL